MNEKTSENPLVGFGPAIPFDAIRAAHVMPAVEALVAQAEGGLKRILDVSGPRTYANTLGALDALTAPLDDAYGVVAHLEGVLGDPDLRTAYNAAQPLITAFYSALTLSEGLYRALTDYAETAEAKALGPVEARFLETTLDDLRRNGAGLDAVGKARLTEINVALADATNRFAQNVVDDTDAYQLIIDDEAQLAGLPASAIAAAKASAASVDHKGWRLTLHAPSFMPVMRHLDDGGIRETLYRAQFSCCTAGPTDNRALLKTVLELRREKAVLLGYDDVADLLLEPRMVKTGAQARAFVNELFERTQPYFAREHTELVAFRRELEGDDAPDLQPWDLAYYAEKLRRARFDLDEELLRPYFAADRVMAGMFEIVRRLYGVTVTRIDDLPVWHADVQTYALNDADGARLGHFYVDLFPRQGKRGGAWMHPLMHGAPPSSPHVGLMCGNLTPPVDGEPALLTHREVETLFHEFGHLLHHLLTTVEVRGLAGTNVAWDFVELPSQIMENWCWQRPALDLFARHYQTDAPLPDDLFQKLSAAQTFRGGYAQMRQLGFATMDLALHRDYDPRSDGPVLDFARKVSAPFSPIPLPDDYAMVASFTHLFASPVGYAAGYYSYKWAEVLDADAFTRFAQEGLFSPEVGAAFRENVLSQGNSRDPAELYAAFMGRGPDQSALLVRAGLVD